MPAVSTNRTRPTSGHSTSASTLSRVVPASSKTTDRSSPTSLLNRLDLPDVRTPDQREPGLVVLVLAASVDDGASGRRSTRRSRSSPTPRPCLDDTGIGSPRPSARNAGTSASSAAASTLFTTTTTGEVARRRRCASWASSSVIPEATSTTQQDELRLLHRPRRLSAGEGLDPGRLVEVARGVDQAEPPPVPRRLELHAIAGHPRVVVGDRLALAEEPVHQGRLADVLTAHDGDPGNVHGSYVPGQLRRALRDRLQRGAERRRPRRDRSCRSRPRRSPARTGSPARPGGPARGARRPPPSPPAPPPAGRRAPPAPPRGTASRGASGKTTVPMSRPSITAPPSPRARCASAHRRPDRGMLRDRAHVRLDIRRLELLRRRPAVDQELLPPARSST